MNTITKNRIKKEIEMLSCSPPAGISCSPTNDQLDLLSAQILGPDGTPFEKGIFHLQIQIPERYPFDPPRVRFMTPIYHPNIDTNGLICLDTLKLPPKGTWRPCLNISTVLMMIRILMAEPGSEDPLMTTIWQEYKYDYTTYVEKAKKWTRIHAIDSLAKMGSDQSSLDCENPPSANGVVKCDDCTNQDTKLKSKQISQSASLASSADLSVDSHHKVIKSKKGLGLSNKRHALEEWDGNAKVTKTL
ncbi:ubiquitin-conjugating enzyme e2 t [Plakobranchus ocellatus]|uniref:Ubiquitin-conjugating enzyme E2 T n=1 Tax=Plakobranchus ocellatus TaxID=259542 RepID=A0AAV4CTA9_9GAST|nr:ubiquitin-conjugating enzyme e2 t [Plakobranchus ocellatus]